MNCIDSSQLNTYAGNMFSPENLKKLAARSREEDLDARALKVDARAQLGEDGNFVIPIEVDAGQLNCNLDASAKLKLKLNVDILAFEAACKIGNRNDRVKRMRELIQLETPVCQLVIKRRRS